MEKTGVEMIQERRKHQIETKGFTVEHDVKENDNGQLLEAVIYIIAGTPNNWPSNWSESYREKLTNKPVVEILADAGAMIAAQIDVLKAINFKG